MKRNKLSIFLVTIASGFLISQNVGAYPIVSEQFANYQTDVLGGPNTGANGGFIPGWNSTQTAVTVTNGAGSLNGLTNGLVASAGDRVFIAATNSGTASGGSVYLKFVNPGTFLASVPTNIYYSFLYRIDAGGTLDPVGQRLVQASKQNSGFTSSFTGNNTHWFLQAREVSGHPQLGISKYPLNGAVTNWVTGTNIAYGQTFFIVVRSKITSATSNEVESLWINPNTNTFGVSEPTPSAVVADGSDDTSTTGVGRFYVPACGQLAELDELRIANNWADVTPPAGQCLTAFINSFSATPSFNASNISTNIDGLSTSFVVNAPDTAPTYQWQISQNNGVSWANISGANSYNYTTPTLFISTDQGNQYRCVVTTPCDGQHVTSAAGTVILVPATTTGVGLIMYDNFSDTFRGNTPVATNNSVWYTTSASSANLDASSGAMVATPVSGSSTLWWGNFLNETNGVATTLVPVTLNVTNAIKVTVPFTVGTMDFHTNNGAMRWGLYDYADGGTLFTNDTTAVGGSTGNGVNVRGYMLSVDFGSTFTANSPLSLSGRSGLNDINLMGTTGDYLSMGSGPSGGGYTNAPGFQPNTAYTLVFQVTRTETNLCRVSATITGGGTNWSFSAIDNNGLTYHRFDTFVMRPNELENTADYFTFPYFEVQVIPTAWEIASISTPTITRVGTNVTLAWTPTPGPSIANFTYSIQYNTNLVNATNWVTLRTNISTLTYTHTNATPSSLMYRVSSP